LADPSVKILEANVIFKDPLIRDAIVVKGLMK